MTDRDLLDRLRTALIPPAAASMEPPAASLELVLASVRAAAQPVQVAPRRRPSARSWARRIAAAGAALTVIGGGGGVAFAAGAPLPPAIRDAAHGLGLPIDSSAVVAARGALRALSDAEGHGNPTSIAARADALRAKLARLEGADHAQLARQAAAALETASRGTMAVGGGDPAEEATPTGTSAEEETPAYRLTTPSPPLPDGRTDTRPAGEAPATTGGDSRPANSPSVTKAPPGDDQHPRPTPPPSTDHRN